MNLAKYFKYVTFYPAIVSILATTLQANIEMYNPENDWIVREAGGSLYFVMSILQATMMAVLSLGLFLNRFPFVRKYILLSALAWFLLPSLYLVNTLLKILFFMDSFILSFFLTFPYIFALLISFILFRFELDS